MNNLFHLFRSALAVARIIILSIFSALMCATQSHAVADPTDTLQLSLTAGMFSDDNLFRLPDGNNSAAGVDPADKSDRITRIGVTIRLDKTLSRQRFLAGVSQIATTGIPLRTSNRA